MMVIVVVYVPVLCPLRKIFEYDLKDDTRHDKDAYSVAAVFMPMVVAFVSAPAVQCSLVYFGQQVEYGK